MQEAFLHYIWKYQRFKTLELSTVDGSKLIITKPGQLNDDAGPDFFNSSLRIDEQLWVGNVEIHINSSDWYAHKHDNDPNYDNVILHVVWHHNAEVYRSDGSRLETLELSDKVDQSLVSNYSRLMNARAWINCENDFPDIDDFTLVNWLERLYIERLEKKSENISQLLEQSRNNWEQVLFVLTMRNFGLKVNADAFESCAKSIDFKIIQRIRTNLIDLESLFFGQMHLLDQPPKDSYQSELMDRYQYLAHKFQISNRGVLPLKFSRMRPGNFPTIRLSQFAALYFKNDHFFSVLMTADSMEEIYNLFKVEASLYWNKHYTFGKETHEKTKRLTTSFIQLLIINTILPLKYTYEKFKGKIDASGLFKVMEEIPIEKNEIVKRFLNLKPMPKTALSSQALIELKSNYCDKNACLSCAIAGRLLL